MNYWSEYSYSYSNVNGKVDERSISKVSDGKTVKVKKNINKKKSEFITPVEEDYTISMFPFDPMFRCIPALPAPKKCDLKSPRKSKRKNKK